MRSKKLVYEVDNINIDNNDLMVHEAVFHNANGYIGIRSNYEEGYPEGYDSIRGSYINGFYDVADMKQAENLYGLVEDKQTMLNIVDTQSILLIINGQTFSMFEGTVLKSKRWLDMERGITGRHVIWRAPNGNELEIEIRRMTSFYQLSLFTIEYIVKALNFSGSVEFISLHDGGVMNHSNSNDPRIARDSVRYLMPVGAFIQDDDASFLVSRTLKSDLSVCTGVKHVLSKTCTINTQQEGHKVTKNIQTTIAENETISLIKYTVFTDTIRNKDCLKAAKEEMEKALSVSLLTMYHNQKSYLNEYWNNCYLEIDGDDDLTSSVNYNMYQLIQSVGKDEFCNIAAKGLSGEGYEGHYFWDTEMYIQPFFNLTQPSITKNLISFRYRTLKEARKNARILGHSKGVLFPWRTIMGTECSGYFPSGSAGYHINGDIAYSVVAYYLATDDIDFMVEKGAEILFETARLWMDVGTYYNNSFRINCVTGPDEYTCMVNNNYYTNVCAQYNLNWAVKLYYLLKDEDKLSDIEQKLHLTEDEIMEFYHAAKCMYLPYDDDLKINPQDDSFLHKKKWDLDQTPKENFPLLLNYHPLHLYRHQVCKQADTVMAHFIFEDVQSEETIRNSFDYYEKITTHDSSLSTCIFSIVASKLGLNKKAYDYFGNSAKLDLFNTHKNTKDGIHTANMGGTYMAIIYGFAGLRIKENGIHFSPSIPDEWKEYRFKINYEDSQIKVVINHNESKFSLIKGSPQQIHINNKLYELKDNLDVSLK
ncbi:MAG: glycoside hydrolase family 65 protein [Anaerolineaceae bacterium]|nr:MAG: glycoside hydrolase family 65 protein [Anaerolineaceae bacterium]